jgi:hypothetical protein
MKGERERERSAQEVFIDRFCKQTIGGVYYRILSLFAFLLLLACFLVCFYLLRARLRLNKSWVYRQRERREGGRGFRAGTGLKMEMERKGGGLLFLHGVLFLPVVFLMPFFLREINWAI